MSADITTSAPAGPAVDGGLLGSGGRPISAVSSILTFHRVLLRASLSRGRLVALGLLAVILIVLSVVSRTSDDPTFNTLTMLGDFGLSLLVPLGAILIASPILGNLVEDRLMVYLWLKPVPRWHLAVAAVLAAVTILLPVVVPSMGIAALIGKASSAAVAAAVAAFLGTLAYVALFTAASATFARGMWWSLLYVLVWENVIARFGDGTARLAIRSYLASIIEAADSTGTIELADRARWAQFVIPIAVTIVFTAYAGFRLRTRDID